VFDGSAWVAPLYSAAQEGHAAVVERMLEAGAAVDQADKNGWTPLFIAVQEGQGVLLIWVQCNRAQLFW